MRYFFAEHIIFVPLVAYVVATVCKGLFLMQKRAFTVHRMLSTGGMPSGHSALVASLAASIGIKYGPFHDLFVICLVLAAVVIYDAMNIRYQSGLHAHALNNLKGGDKKLNESLGHLPSETLVGTIVGVGVAVLLMQL